MDNSSDSVSLVTETTKYRASMARFLQLSLVAMNDIVSTVEFDEFFRPMDQGKFDEDPIKVFRRMSNLLIAKARLHVIAALCANKSSNIHSLAVQMRPVLECAGQIVSVVKDLVGKSPGAESRIGQYFNADYYQTVIRLSKGQIDHNELLEKVNAANLMKKEPLRKIKKFRESEKVRDLEFGGNWYGHLSNCFYHTDLLALKNLSYFGGVSSCNTVHDEYAFAALLDYLTYQVMIMLLYAALCPDGTIQDNKNFEKVAELLREKKTVSDNFRDKLMAMAANTTKETWDIRGNQ